MIIGSEEICGGMVIFTVIARVASEAKGRPILACNIVNGARFSLNVYVEMCVIPLCMVMKEFI